MTNHLITKWFGCFLVDEHNQIVEQYIFSKTRDELVEILEKIRSDQILDVEKKFVKDEQPFVAEKRLQHLGVFKPEKNVFSTFFANPVDFGFSLDLFQEVMCSLTDKEIYYQLDQKDYQVIQQVNALDELQHIDNMIGERIAAWDMYPGHEQFQKPIIEIKNNVARNQSVLKQQIESAVTDLAPNTTELVGPMIAARLIAHAGSLRKLAMLPSSSIQLLGAEKALFRFKKQGGKPPKHGVIFQHPLISKSPYARRGKHARLLSAKIAIAAKADMFTKRFIAPMLKDQLYDLVKKK